MSVLWQTELWDSRLLFQGFRQSAVRVQTTLRNVGDSTATNQSWCNATLKTKENLLRNSHQWKRHEQESWLIRRFTAPAALTHNRKQLRISVSSFDFQSPFLTTKKTATHLHHNELCTISKSMDISKSCINNVVHRYQLQSSNHSENLFR